MQQQQQTSQEQQQQQQQTLAGADGLFARPAAGWTVYEEVRTAEGTRYRPTTLEQASIAVSRPRVG